VCQSHHSRWRLKTRLLQEQSLVLLQLLAPKQLLAQVQAVGVLLVVQKDQDVVSDSVPLDCLLRVHHRIAVRRPGLSAERPAP
jgi:hypothetical protein